MKLLADAFEIVAKRFSEDDEAQIFYAIYLTATQSPTDKTFAAALKAAQILEAQFAKHPEHPGVAHYLIHSYDYPPIAEKGLMAAKRYAEIAPSAPHALAHALAYLHARRGMGRIGCNQPAFSRSVEGRKGTWLRTPCHGLYGVCIHAAGP